MGNSRPSHPSRKRESFVGFKTRSVRRAFEYIITTYSPARFFELSARVVNKRRCGPVEGCRETRVYDVVM